MDRRTLLKTMGLGSLLLPIAGRGWAADTGGNGPRLVVVMLRGAVDGLNVVVPYGEDNYYRLRGSIAIPRPGVDGGALDLDSHFGLHPALEPLLPLWQSRKLAFVQAAGSPDSTRSHFDAQDYMESGTPGDKNTADGWMNRLLAQLALAPQTMDANLDAVSLGPVLPRIFSGPQVVANVPLGRDAARPTAMDNAQVNAAYDRMYASADAGALGQAYREGRASRSRILSDLTADPDTKETMQADNGAPPPQGFSLDASQLATLMRRNPGLRLAFMQLGGWDTHVNQGGATGQLANHLRPLAEGLSTLATQLGSDFDNTVVVVMSEFGRTARQNGTNGTDHGHGNAMWVLGGPVHGGTVYGDWPGVDDASLHEGRDLAVTTDFRSVLARACAGHLRLRDAQLAAVFPKAPTTGHKAVSQLL
jgi:uncharacterized protein (DUF1501 family)